MQIQVVESEETFLDAEDDEFLVKKGKKVRGVKVWGCREGRGVGGKRECGGCGGATVWRFIPDLPLPVPQAGSKRR